MATLKAVALPTLACILGHAGCSCLHNDGVIWGRLQLAGWPEGQGMHKARTVCLSYLEL